MKRKSSNKLCIRFHNPNTNEETVKYITELLAEVAVTKVLKAKEAYLAEHRKSV